MFTENDLVKAFERNNYTKIIMILKEMNWYNTPLVMLATLKGKITHEHVASEPILATAVRLCRGKIVRWLLSFNEIDVNISYGNVSHCLDILVGAKHVTFEDVQQTIISFTKRDDLHYPNLFDFLMDNNMLFFNIVFEHSLMYLDYINSFKPTSLSTQEKLYSEQDLKTAFKSNDISLVGEILKTNGWYNTRFRLLAGLGRSYRNGCTEPILSAAVRLKNLEMTNYLLSLPDIDINVVTGRFQHCLDFIQKGEHEMIRPFLRPDLNYPNIMDMLLKRKCWELVEVAIKQKIAIKQYEQTYVEKFAEHVDWESASTFPMLRVLAKMYSGNPFSEVVVSNFIDTVNSLILDTEYDLLIISYPDTYIIDNSEVVELERLRIKGYVFLKLHPIFKALACSQHVKALRTGICYLSRLGLDLLLNITEQLKTMHLDDLNSSINENNIDRFNQRNDLIQAYMKYNDVTEEESNDDEYDDDSDT